METNLYEVRSGEIQGRSFLYRAYFGVAYVQKPVLPEIQKINIFVPEAYFHGGAVNGYTACSAPLFVPNTVGGYMPGWPCDPESDRWNGNTILSALLHGYVVASPGIRGRTQKDAVGLNIGKAPACIVDYKASIRFLRRLGDDIPGNKERIVTNGTSAGGALSALIGSSGNHPDYEPYLKEIGAFPERDDVFAASCYCPITDLDHADMAYEWQFDGIYEYTCSRPGIDRSGNMVFSSSGGKLSDDQITLSRKLVKAFPAYVNSLGLASRDGTRLILNADGSGSFRSYIESVLLASARTSGYAMNEIYWVKTENSGAYSVDFRRYAETITRMKETPAFDAVDMSSPENDLFGTADRDASHFTAFSTENSGMAADARIVKMMNPLPYIDDSRAVKAPFFRIRHGERDRDTSLAVSAILNLKLMEAGVKTDYFSPWNTPHSGDYDLDELFKWIDGVCGKLNLKQITEEFPS